MIRSIVASAEVIIALFIHSHIVKIRETKNVRTMWETKTKPLEKKIVFLVKKMSQHLDSC